MPEPDCTGLPREEGAIEDLREVLLSEDRRRLEELRANIKYVALKEGSLVRSVMEKLVQGVNNFIVLEHQALHSQELLDPLRAELGLAPDEPLVGMVAHLTPWKGHEEFLRLALAVKDTVSGVRFLVSGGAIYETEGHDGYGERLMRRAVDLGLGGRVHFLGNRDDIPEILAALDVLVHVPSAPEPFGRVVALDPSSGRERWAFDSHVDRQGNWGDFANRGVSTWLDPRARPGAACRRRIYLGTIDARIIALDAKTGAPCRDFGERGTVTLRRGLHNTPYYTEEYELTSPPAIVNGLVVAGSAVADNNRTNAASGEVRAFDARTGALRWSWDPVPRDSTDPAWSTWRGAMSHGTGAANAWSVIVADSARDLVFVPTGSASPDYFGGERLGDNRYANSIVALRASTGKVVWHFQTVHHDLWDYDNAAPPLLANRSTGPPTASMTRWMSSACWRGVDSVAGSALVLRSTPRGS